MGSEVLKGGTMTGYKAKLGDKGLIINLIADEEGLKKMPELDQKLVE